MDNNVKQIFDIMSDAECKIDKKIIYRVPSYQRGYRWDVGQVVSLFDDIHRNSMKYSKKFENSDKKATGYEYCIQPLVLKKDTESDKEIQYIVIDGQQRLTTLSLIFQVLNQLEIDLKIHNQDEKKDNITIIYDRANVSDISKISQICSTLLSNQKFEYSDIKSLQSYTSKIKDIEKEINTLINEQDNIDYQFMINNYIYIYLFFKSIILDREIPCEYLGYMGEEVRKKYDCSTTRLTQLRDIFKYQVSIIWYELENDDEEGIFEKFNAGKIPLTQSELVKVKALFIRR